jgi:divalent metal cation (Fe/Co/Zn/Cd) transporter
MKEIKKFILVNFIVLVITVIGGFVCKSNTMLSVGILDLLLLISSLCVTKRKENTKFKGVISSLLGFIFIMGSLAFILYVYSSKVLIPSFFILLFMLITLVVKYLVSCFYTNINYQKKKGILSYGNLNSSVDFIIYGILLLTLILGKVNKWVWFLKYADRVGTVLVVFYVIYKSFRLIVNSFKYLESEELTKVVEDEITSRNEVKKIERILVNSFGGVRYITIDIVLNESISLVDINSFVITLQDYLLKYGDVVDINMVNGVEKKRKTKPKVRSLKQDARNSGSRNSKTSTKKKNTKKKSKKR